MVQLYIPKHQFKKEKLTSFRARRLRSPLLHKNKGATKVGQRLELNFATPLYLYDFRWFENR